MKPPRTHSRRTQPAPTRFDRGLRGPHAGPAIYGDRDAACDDRPTDIGCSDSDAHVRDHLRCADSTDAGNHRGYADSTDTGDDPHPGDHGHPRDHCYTDLSANHLAPDRTVDHGTQGRPEEYDDDGAGRLRTNLSRTGGICDADVRWTAPFPDGCSRPRCSPPHRSNGHLGGDVSPIGGRQTKRTYVLRGRLWCSTCGRKMQADTTEDEIRALAAWLAEAADGFHLAMEAASQRPGRASPTLSVTVRYAPGVDQIEIRQPRC